MPSNNNAPSQKGASARRWRTALALELLFLVALSGCSAKPPILPPAPVLPLVIPLDLVQPCLGPTLAGDSYGDFLSYSLDAAMALESCNQRMGAVRSIVEKHNAQPEDTPDN